MDVEKQLYQLQIITKYLINLFLSFQLNQSLNLYCASVQQFKLLKKVEFKMSFLLLTCIFSDTIMIQYQTQHIIKNN